MVVRQLTDGQELDCVLLVRARELRTKRDGSEFLRLTLGDRTGSVPAIVRDGAADLSAVCAEGAAVHIHGSFTVHPRYGPQIAIRSLRAASMLSSRCMVFSLVAQFVAAPWPSPQPISLAGEGARGWMRGYIRSRAPTAPRHRGRP